MLAYNVIRGYMVQAARRVGLSPLALSFTSCWRRVRDMLVTWRLSKSVQKMAKKIASLLARLARCLLPKRPPDRVEPRAVHRRPNVYPQLKGSRAEARQQVLAARQQKPVKC